MKEQNSLHNDSLAIESLEDLSSLFCLHSGYRLVSSINHFAEKEIVARLFMNAFSKFNFELKKAKSIFNDNDYLFMFDKSCAEGKVANFDYTFESDDIKTIFFKAVSHYSSLGSIYQEEENKAILERFFNQIDPGDIHLESHLSENEDGRMICLTYAVDELNSVTLKINQNKYLNESVISGKYEKIQNGQKITNIMNIPKFYLKCYPLVSKLNKIIESVLALDWKFRLEQDLNDNFKGQNVGIENVKRFMTIFLKKNNIPDPSDWLNASSSHYTYYGDIR